RRKNFKKRQSWTRASGRPLRSLRGCILRKNRYCRATATSFPRELLLFPISYGHIFVPCSSGRPPFFISTNRKSTAFHIGETDRYSSWTSGINRISLAATLGCDVHHGAPGLECSH